MGRPDFDRVADIYDETRGLPPRVLARVVGILADALAGKRVLEVGVGTGRFAVPLQKSGIDVVGTDIARGMVARGRSKGLRNVAFADGAHLPFRTGAFDAVTTNHVLHLVPGWRAVLREVARVCRGEYFSILQRPTGTRVRPAYDERVKALGFDPGPPRFHERELPEALPPKRTLRAISFSESTPARAAIASLERREYSSQWGVPEAIHRQAIETLRKEFGDRGLTFAYDLEIDFWGARDVGRFADAGA